MSRRRVSYNEYHNISERRCYHGIHAKPLCIRRNLNHHHEPQINKTSEKSKLISKLDNHDNKKLKL